MIMIIIFIITYTMYITCILQIMHIMFIMRIMYIMYIKLCILCIITIDYIYIYRERERDIIHILVSCFLFMVLLCVLSFIQCVYYGSGRLCGGKSGIGSEIRPVTDRRAGVQRAAPLIAVIFKDY